VSAFSRILKGLISAYPLSNIGEHKPADLSEFVQLVHMAIGPWERIGQGETRYTGFVSGAAGVQDVAAVTSPPVNFVRWVLRSEVSHDDPVARQIRFRIDNPNLAATDVQLISSQYYGSGAAIALGVRFSLSQGFPRGVILGPGERLMVNVPVAAANIIDTKSVFVDISQAELTP